MNEAAEIIVLGVTGGVIFSFALALAFHLWGCAEAWLHYRWHKRLLDRYNAEVASWNKGNGRTS